MTRRTFIFDPDLDAMVEITRTNRPSEPGPGSGLQIIRDIEPYRTVGSDVAVGGQAEIGGRRQHREFLARNGYVEVGNERPRERVESYVERRVAQQDRVNDIKRAAGYL